MIGRATFELLLRFMPISAVWATAAAAEPIANNVVEFNIVPLAEDLIFMSSPDDDPSVKGNQWRCDSIDLRAWTSAATELTKSGPTDRQAVTTFTADANGTLSTVVVTSDCRRPLRRRCDLRPDGAGWRRA